MKILELSRFEGDDGVLVIGFGKETFLILSQQSDKILASAFGKSVLELHAIWDSYYRNNSIFGSLTETAIHFLEWYDGKISFGLHRPIWKRGGKSDYLGVTKETKERVLEIVRKQMAEDPVISGNFICKHCGLFKTVNKPFFPIHDSRKHSTCPGSGKSTGTSHMIFRFNEQLTAPQRMALTRSVGKDFRTRMSERKMLMKATEFVRMKVFSASISYADLARDPSDELQSIWDRESSSTVVGCIGDEISCDDGLDGIGLVLLNSSPTIIYGPIS